MTVIVQDALLFFLGAVVAWVIKPAYEGYAKRLGELTAEKSRAKELERERALGKQDVDQANETHKSELAAANLMRTAALDKRLVVHQEAFALWWELRNLVHGDSKALGDHVIKCQAWWVSNCLYLDPTVREDFSIAYASASIHRSYVESTVRTPQVRDALKENWARIMAPGLSLPRAVELPPIAEDRRAPNDPLAKIVSNEGLALSNPEAL